MNKPQLLTILLSLSSLLVAQREEVKPFSTLILGNSGSVLFEDKSISPTSPYDYWEYHWTINLATDLNKWFRVGLDHISIYNNQDNGDPFYLYGGFVQVDFIPSYDNRLFLEFNYHKGDFCDCDELFPYRKKGLNFFGGATGFDWALSRYFHLDVGMTLAWAHHQKLGWSVFGEYFVGIDIYLLAPKPRAKATGRDAKHL